MLQWFSGKRKKGVAWLLLFLLAFSGLYVPVTAKAAEIGLDDEKLFDSKTNVYRIFGLHNFTDGAVWTYRTTAFNVANGECTDISNPPAGVKTARLAINRIEEKLKIDGDKNYNDSTYVISGQDFANAFQTLYQDEIEGAIASGQRTVTKTMYFNNIFKVAYREDSGKEGKYDGAPINQVYSFQSAEEYHTASAMAANPYVSSWSASDFAGFYNSPYEYTVNILETKINYVDKKTGKDIVTHAESAYGLRGGYIHFTLPEKQITVNGKTYVYNGSAVLDKKDGFAPMQMQSFDGSLTWTMDKDGMELDIYFDEGEVTQEVPVQIFREVSMDGSSYTTVESFDSGSTVLAGERFSYTPDANWQDGSGNNYTYTESWYYKYTDADGKTVSVTDTADGAPVIHHVPEVKDGTTLNVYIRYDVVKQPEPQGNKNVNIRISTQISEQGASYSTAATADYGTLQNGAAFSYNPAATYTKNSVTYKYTNEWYYTYVNAMGETITELPTSTKPGIGSLPETKSGTYLEVYIRYKKESVVPTAGVTVMPTVAPTAPPQVTATPTNQPTAMPGPLPTATPSPSPTPVKQPSSNQTAPTNQGRYYKELITPESRAGIKAEEENLNRYDVLVGIATQEDLYTFGHATGYMFGYDIVHTTGTKTYPIRVDKKYILKWQEGTEAETDSGGTEGDSGGTGEAAEEAEPEILTEEVTLTTYVYVTRGYGYWEIDSFGMYVPDSMTLYNYALPGGSVTMTADSSKLNPVELDISVTDYSDNVSAPATASSGIVLETEVVESRDNHKPEIPREDFETLAFNAAHSQTGNIRVKNDRLVYRNIAVLDEEEREYISLPIKTYPLDWSRGDMTADLFHAGNMVIDAKKDNGVFYSSGTVTYKAMSCNVGGEWTKTYPLTYDVNNVLIHTPVFCDGVVSSDNNKYVQLSNPLSGSEVYHLVLDENSTLNDFTVSISNFGEHLPSAGYFTRDYRKIKRLPDSDLSNIERTAGGMLRNEVKFQFDVYADIGNDYNPSNDIFYPAGTWLVIGEATQRFYLPLTVAEGFYGADFRTVAVNANGRLTLTQEVRNTIWQNYVATDTALFSVSGRVYGLNIRDISDYPIWEEVFRIPGLNRLKINYPDQYPLGVNSTTYSKDKSYNYTVGTKDQYGNDTGRDPKFTLPLVGGSHPYYGGLVGILKRGYSVRFSLDTIGTYYDDTAKVVVTPTYYWVDKNGQNRTKVDLYYSAEVLGKQRYLIKSGESIDLANIARYRAGDRYLGIPQAELDITAAIRNILIGDWEWTYGNLVYGAAKVEMTAPFRTYTGTEYADSVLSGPNADRVTSAGITEADLIKSKQSWYGSFFVPGNARAVDSTFDVFEYAKKIPINYTESFWKKDGYIIVNLEIKVYDKDGKERLSYLNKVHEDYYCNMWKMEGPMIGKSDNGRVTMYFEPGDFMIYSVEHSATEDHVVGGIY